MKSLRKFNLLFENIKLNLNNNRQAYKQLPLGVEIQLEKILKDACDNGDLPYISAILGLPSSNMIDFNESTNVCTISFDLNKFDDFDYEEFLDFLKENEKTISEIIRKLNSKYNKIKYKNNIIKLVWFEADTDVSEQQFSSLLKQILKDACNNGDLPYISDVLDLVSYNMIDFDESTNICTIPFDFTKYDDYDPGFLDFLWENEKTISEIIRKLNSKYNKIKYKNNIIKLVWADVSPQQFSQQSDAAWTKFTKKFKTDTEIDTDGGICFYYDDLCRMGMYDKTTHTLFLNLNGLSERGTLDDILHDYESWTWIDAGLSRPELLAKLLDMLNSKYNKIDDINFRWFYE